MVALNDYTANAERPAQSFISLDKVSGFDSATDIRRAYNLSAHLYRPDYSCFISVADS